MEDKAYSAPSILFNYDPEGLCDQSDFHSTDEHSHIRQYPFHIHYQTSIEIHKDGRYYLTQHFFYHKSE